MLKCHINKLIFQSAVYENGNGVSCKTIHRKNFLKLTITEKIFFQFEVNASLKVGFYESRYNLQVYTMLTVVKKKKAFESLTLDGKEHSHLHLLLNGMFKKHSVILYIFFGMK